MRKSPEGSIAQDGSLNLLKCLLVFGVVLQHSAFQRFSVPAQELVASLQHFFAFVVVGFFWAAGFLIRRETSWTGFITKRFWRLMVPFLVVSLVNGVAFRVIAAATGRDFGYAMSVPEFLRALVTLQGVGPQMYFLPYLFVLQVLAFPLGHWLSNAGYFAALSAGLFLLWLFAGEGCGPTGPALPNTLLYFSALLLGMACGTPAIAAVGRFWLPVAVLILAACVWLPAGAWHNLCCWAAPAALYLALRQIGARIAWTGMNNDIVSVFLWHTPVLLPVLSVLCVQLWPPGYVALVVSFTAAVVLAVVLGRVLVKSGLGWVEGKG